jgi:hypothetical protein
MADSEIRPIDTCMDRWHQHLRGKLEGGLDAVLHPDVVFLSPIVFTPQKGIEVTKLYLTAAGGTLGGDDDPGAAEAANTDHDKPSAGAFRYTKELRDGNHAMLEFETSIEGKYVNGIDLITCDDDGMVTEFKVLIRPLQAVNLVHRQMGDMLDKLSS